MSRIANVALVPLIAFCVLVPNYFSIVGELPSSVSRGFSVGQNPFRYSSYYHDVESKLYYLKARYYSPALARFIHRDTYDLPNRYAYCDGDPVNRLDSSGHYSVFGSLVLNVFLMGASAYSFYGALQSFFGDDQSSRRDEPKTWITLAISFFLTGYLMICVLETVNIYFINSSFEAYAIKVLPKIERKIEIKELELQAQKQEEEVVAAQKVHDPIRKELENYVKENKIVGDCDERMKSDATYKDLWDRQVAAQWELYKKREKRDRTLAMLRDLREKQTPSETQFGPNFSLENLTTLRDEILRRLKDLRDLG